MESPDVTLGARDRVGDSSLEDRLRAIHNHIYANEGIKQYPRVMDEIAKILFAKLAAERTSEGRDEGPSWPDEPERVRALFATATSHSSHLGIFGQSERINLSDEALAFAISMLGSPSLRSQDPKGVAFQTILGPTLRGELGQFFTPDPVKQLLVTLTGPRPGELVADPASGSAGLLIDVGRDTPGAALRAVEIDSSLARLARMNLHLAGVDDPDVIRTDSLRPLKELAETTDGQLGENVFDVVVTNPPFGSRGRVSDPSILAGLPHSSAGKRSVAPEVLFVERVMQMLKPGGRAGVVLPSGILSNPSARHVRRLLRESGRIYATISLPTESFQPTGNSVNAAVVFFTKGASASATPHPVFRAISSEIGYDHRGRTRAAATPDAPLIVDAWRRFLDTYGGEHLWK